VAFWVSLASMAFPLHPAARLLAREIAFAREASVDAQVAATGALEYARFLLRSLESAHAEDRHANPALVSMADTALTRRIDMLVSKSAQHSGSARTWASLAASALTVVALVGIAPSSWGETKHGRLAVSGRLHPDQIRRVMRESFGSFEKCYEALPQLASTNATLRFTIGEQGRVTQGQVTAESQQLRECMRAALFTLVFPTPIEGVVAVEYPIAFGPG